MNLELPFSRNDSSRNDSVRDSARRAFAETADPEAYIPRDATESVISSLEAWAADDREGSTVAALVGPPGLGKTLLLRVFEARNERQSLYLPYAGLPPTELIDWVYGLLSRSPSAEFEREVLLGQPTRVLDPLFALAPSSDEPFFLLIDDADSMPEETLRVMIDELPRKRSTLRILMAMNEDAKASRLLAGFDSLRPRTVRLQRPMSEGETGDYLLGRLSWAGAPGVELGRLDSAQTRRIFALSAGVPQMVHRIAYSFFADDRGTVPGDLDAKQRRENWMGRPFEDDPLELDP